MIAVGFRDPFIATRVVGIATVAQVSIVLVYQIGVCTRLLRAGADRKSALYFVMSWLILFVAALPDFLWWLGFGETLGGVRLGSIGLALFAVLMSLLLSQKHAQSLRSSDGLNAELAQRVGQLEARRAEIEQLNTELRRQVADRALQIYAAVALARTRSVTAHLQVGEIVQGRYRVERPLGSGGMGTVYEVMRVTDGRRFALKVPREVHGESLARLAREAQIASTLSHPNVVSIIDVDVASTGFLFLVMELVEGTSLHEHYERFGDVRWALPVLAQIAAGLAALHRVGIVHRDLKPGNILVMPRADGALTIKISDFGISLHAGTEEASGASPPPSRLSTDAATAEITVPEPLSPAPLRTEVLPPPSNPRPTSEADAFAAPGPPAGVAASSFLTRTGHMRGTPLYMAPEACDGRSMLTPAVDIFALGVLAQELLTGRRPFTQPPVIAMMARDAVPVPSRIQEGWPTCQPALATVLDACLSLDATRRPTAADLALMFIEFAGATPALGVRSSG